MIKRTPDCDSVLVFAETFKEISGARRGIRQELTFSLSHATMPRFFCLKVFKFFGLKDILRNKTDHRVHLVSKSDGMIGGAWQSIPVKTYHDVVLMICGQSYSNFNLDFP